MSATVLLIRHPESAWNRRGIYQGRRDISLSPLGRVQAELVAARLRGEAINGIVCSPLRRASTLARAIARHHGLDPDTDERLTEISHGPWEGLSRAEVAERYPDLYDTWLARPHEVTFPAGESLADVHARSMPVIEALLQQAGRTFVVVTHDTVCRLAVAAASGRPIEGFMEVDLENAGITTLVGHSLLGSARRVNDVTHLGPYRVALGTQAL